MATTRNDSPRFTYLPVAFVGAPMVDELLAVLVMPIELSSDFILVEILPSCQQQQRSWPVDRERKSRRVDL